MSRTARRVKGTASKLARNRAPPAKRASPVARTPSTPDRNEHIDQLLRQAIGEKRTVKFALKGLSRVGEPHDYGVNKGVPRLFFWQTAGQSKSGKVPDWRLADLADISDVEL